MRKIATSDDYVLGLGLAGSADHGGLCRCDVGDLSPRCQGCGVAAHGMTIFNLVPFLDGPWECHQVEKYLGRKLCLGEG